MSRKKKNHPEKTWPTQSLRAELAAITVAKRACDWTTEVTWTVSYTAWVIKDLNYLWYLKNCKLHEPTPIK